jgi:serine/threonine protein kinase
MGADRAIEAGRSIPYNPRVTIDLSPSAEHGDYQILERIGAGGMAEVWSARRERDGRTVALKRMLPYLATDPEFAAMFDDEARILGSVRHPNVVEILDSGRQDGSAYIAMELVDGPTLEELAARLGRLPAELAAFVVAEAAAGLDHAHRATDAEGQPLEIVHRGLSHRDILVSRDGAVKVADFGIARALGRAKVTLPGVLKGRFGYMSPEQLQGLPVDRRTDIFVLGVILWELLAGRRLFAGATDFETLELVREAVVPPPSSIDPRVDRRLDPIVLQACARDPARRYAWASELRSALATYLEQVTFVVDRSTLAAAVREAEQRPAPSVVPMPPPPLVPTEPALPADDELRTPVDGILPPPVPIDTLPPPPIPPIPAERADWTLAGINTNLVFDVSRAGAEATLAPADLARASVELPPLEPGEELDRGWQVVRELGAGGFARVYLVESRSSYLSEQRAIKVPRYEHRIVALEKYLHRRFKAWKVLSDRSPRHVVRLIDVERVTIRGTATVATYMEHMGGGSLLDLVEERGVKDHASLRAMVRLFSQIAEAVAELHRMNLLHRDIKPANVLLDVDRERCKLSDFELTVSKREAQSETEQRGTPRYMAPECFGGPHTEASDIYSLGATLFHAVAGRAPDREAPIEAADANPLVTAELSHLIRRCMDEKPANRPSSASDVLAELAHIGLLDEGAAAAPSALAALLERHLPKEDLEYLTRSLEVRGFTANDARADGFDLLEAYCYTESPRSILSEHCTKRQIAAMARDIGIDPGDDVDRDALITELLQRVGFLYGEAELSGLDGVRRFVERQALEVAHVTSIDECHGITLAGLSAVERSFDVMVQFFGQLVYGSGLPSFLSRRANGKPHDRLTLGEKVSAMRALLSDRPDVPLPARVLKSFRWPILGKDTFERIDDLVKTRNKLAHGQPARTVDEAKARARRVLDDALTISGALADSPFAPSIVQISARHDEVYGRRYYVGRDERGRTERIFTPLALEVGRTYLFYPLTHPIRIRPLIFPYG